MKDFVFSEMTNSSFVTDLGITSKRFAKQTLCAQIAINAFSLDKNGRFCRTRYDDLSSFFSEYSSPSGPDTTQYNKTTRNIRDTLDWMIECYKSESGRLNNRSYILSLYFLVYRQKIVASLQPVFKRFSFVLWKRLREEARSGIDRKNRELYSFQSYLSSAPGEQYQIENRHAKLVEYFDFYRKREKIVGD
jgi:hypothetical protein